MERAGGNARRWGLAHSTNDVLHAILLTANAFLLPDFLSLSFSHSL